MAFRSKPPRKLVPDPRVHFTDIYPITELIVGSGSVLLEVSLLPSSDWLRLMVIVVLRTVPCSHRLSLQFVTELIQNQVTPGVRGSAIGFLLQCILGDVVFFFKLCSQKTSLRMVGQRFASEQKSCCDVPSRGKDKQTYAANQKEQCL